LKLINCHRITEVPDVKLATLHSTPTLSFPSAFSDLILSSPNRTEKLL
jgi:hypothetical protein